MARTHEVLTYEASSRSDAATAWSLVARPARWPEWAPHLRGAWGLGDPEVREGARGAARLLGVVPVPATITRTVPGRLWTWRVGPVELDHRVEPRAGGGCVVGVDLRAPAPLEAVLRATYGPVVALLVAHLARVAERSDTGSLSRPGAPPQPSPDQRLRRRCPGSGTP